jgi:UDP-3-O-[3-hydroxymyristoyl] glucosamine N-acyltransferase
MMAEIDFAFASADRRRLADAALLIAGTSVVREASFENLGMFRNHGRNMLTVFYDEKFRPQFEENLSNFSAVITTAALMPTIPERLGVLVAENPLTAFLKLHFHFCEKDASFYALDLPTSISSRAKVHPMAVIAPRGVVIEDDVEIEPFAVIKELSHIRRGARIGPGVAIGGAGFEMRYIDGTLTYVPHGGGVDIGEDAHILANACIAKAVFGGATRIGVCCKIDHLVHIAHAAVIGRNCRLVAGSSIGGATRLGDDVWVGPNAVIANSLRVGDKAWIALGAAVVRDVPAGARVANTFARQMP